MAATTHDAPPQRMTAIAIAAPGGPDMLQPETVRTPSPGTGEVLIAVAAAGVNRPDVVQRQGLYPPPPGAPDTLGVEVAGRVVAVGQDVTSPQPGEVVCALVAGGGYAEYCVAPAVTCLPIPDGLTLVEAAGLPETAFTVWSNVFDRADLRAGEAFLVHGGTSGIGTTAIQFAKAFDARVFATAGSDEKCALCRKLGADRAINYKTEDFVEVVKGEHGGVDVILDMVGGDYLPRNIKCLKPDGRHVSIAFLAGSRATLDIAPVMMKRLTLTGSTLRPRDNAFKGAIAARLKSEIWPLLAAGRIRTVVDSTFPLEEAGAAHARMERAAHMSKIVPTTGR